MLSLHRVTGRISVWCYAKSKWLTVRNENISFMKSHATESIFTRTHTICRTLVNGNEIILTIGAGCSGIVRASEAERILIFGLPFDGAEVLLHPKADGIAKITQISYIACEGCTVVEGPHDRRWRTEVCRHPGGTISSDPHGIMDTLILHFRSWEWAPVDTTLRTTGLPDWRPIST